MSAEHVMKKYEKELMKNPAVARLGIGEKNGKEAIIIFIKKDAWEKKSADIETLPKRLDGYETVIEKEIVVN